MKIIKCRLKEAGGALRKAGVVYAKTVDAGRIDADSLVDMMVECCCVSRSQVVAVLSALVDKVGDMLELGHSVEVPGLGYLSPQVKGKVTKGKSGKTVVSDAKCRVKLKVHRKFMERFDGIVYQPVSSWVRSNTTLSQAEAVVAVNVLADKQVVFCAHDFADEVGCSESYAARQLAALVEQGVVARMRLGRMNVYRLLGDSTVG